MSTEPPQAKPPTLLAGGNPQIPKGQGDEPVQAYLAALPDWKRDVGVHLDSLITDTLPNVVKQVKWNTPFYGIAGQGWFLGFHCLTKYVKVSFLNGASLDPLPPIDAKDPNTRYWHIFEDDEIDDAQLTAWVEQASKLPGWGES